MEERLKTLLSSPNPGGQAGEVRTQIEPMKYTFILIYGAMTLYCELIVPQKSRLDSSFETFGPVREIDQSSFEAFETFRGIKFHDV